MTIQYKSSVLPLCESLQTQLRFAAVHDAMDAYVVANPSAGATGSPGERQVVMLAALVDTGVVSQAEADTFNLVHDRLEESGLMQ